MADYPEWVLKYKEKGTYVNKVGDKYYLYAAHSERIKGTDKVKRISDGYLGRITEKDGLIPTKDKVQESPIVLEYGLLISAFSYSHNIYSGFKRSFKSNAPYVMTASMLTYLYGLFNQVLYETSFLSILFPSLDMDSVPTKTQATAIQRGASMIQDTLNTAWGDDYSYILLYFPRVHMTIINKKLYRSTEPTIVLNLRLKYNIRWDNPTWLP